MLSVVDSKPKTGLTVGSGGSGASLTGVKPTSGSYSDYQRTDAAPGMAATWTPGVAGASTTGNTGSQAPSDGGSGRTYDPLNQAAVDATNKTISSLGSILANALKAARTGYSNAKSLFDTQEKQQKEQYEESNLSNMQNYDSNLAASLRAGRSGLSGLMAALRGGGGAGNKFATDWVQNTVGDTTSNDIREGYNTYDENSSELENALSMFLTELSGKRQENEDILENNERAARLYDAEQRQSLFQKLAELYSDAGMNNESGTYLSRAGELAPTIASNMGATVSKYDRTPVEVKAADITAFDSPEKQSMTATNQQKGSGIFSLTDPRRRERREVLAGA